MNTKNGIYSTTRTLGGFTIVDLVVATALLAMLIGLLLPALATTKAASHGMFCLNNKKQLIIAFATYASDHQGKFPDNFADPSSSIAGQQWISGSLDWAANPGNTNTSYITNPASSTLAVYFGRQAKVVKCPSDQYVSAVQRAKGWTQRIRSVSASFGVGNGSALNFDPSFYVYTRKFSDLVRPPPSEVWVYADEHPDSVNDAGMFGPVLTQWFDFPASYHEGGATFAFADGRAQLHKWQASAKDLIITTSTYPMPVVKPNDADILWMRAHSPHR